MPNYANVVITVKAETQKEIDDFVAEMSANREEMEKYQLIHIILHYRLRL